MKVIKFSVVAVFLIETHINMINWKKINLKHLYMISVLLSVHHVSLVFSMYPQLFVRCNRSLIGHNYWKTHAGLWPISDRVSNQRANQRSIAPSCWARCCEYIGTINFYSVLSNLRCFRFLYLFVIFFSVSSVLIACRLRLFELSLLPLMGTL